MTDDTKPPARAHVLERDKERPIRFKGWLLGAASNSWDTASPDFSGSTGRRQALALYETEGGKYVCERVGFSQWQGERTRHEGAVCTTIEEVMAFFGHGRLAKELYDDAGLDTAEDVA